MYTTVMDAGLKPPLIKPSDKPTAPENRSMKFNCFIPYPTPPQKESIAFILFFARFPISDVELLFNRSFDCWFTLLK